MYYNIPKILERTGVPFPNVLSLSQFPKPEVNTILDFVFTMPCITDFITHVCLPGNTFLKTLLLLLLFLSFINWLQLVFWAFLFRTPLFLKFIEVVHGAVIHLFSLLYNILFFLSVPQTIHLFCLCTLGFSFYICSYENCIFILCLMV